MASPPNQPPPSPSQLAILGTYAVLGAVLSFGVGRTPGTLPPNLAEELWLSTIAICAFVSLYSVYDVMGCGLAKGAHFKDVDPNVGNAPEPVRLAQRAQANQVEQFPAFVVSSLLFGVFVNGIVGGVLSVGWVALRVLYGRAYRNSVGVPWSRKGLTKFTIPCYFLLNSMSAGTCVHMLRYAVGRYVG